MSKQLQVSIWRLISRRTRIIIISKLSFDLCRFSCPYCIRWTWNPQESECVLLVWRVGSVLLLNTKDASEQISAHHGYEHYLWGRRCYWIHDLLYQDDQRWLGDKPWAAVQEIGPLIMGGGGWHHTLGRAACWKEDWDCKVGWNYWGIVQFGKLHRVWVMNISICLIPKLAANNKVTILGMPALFLTVTLCC